jgi:hypothetical protein
MSTPTTHLVLNATTAKGRAQSGQPLALDSVQAEQGIYVLADGTRVHLPEIAALLGTGKVWPDSYGNLNAWIWLQGKIAGEGETLTAFDLKEALHGATRLTARLFRKGRY